jgi:hypothetical protein
MTDGVPLDQLYCPTCGDRIVDFNMHSDPEEFQTTEPIRPISAVAATDWYLLCPNRHKWTVTRIWRAVNYPDRVQLGRYLGKEWP